MLRTALATAFALTMAGPLAAQQADPWQPQQYVQIEAPEWSRDAVLYQINASLISLEDIRSASELRRKLESNGTAQRLRLTVTILVPHFQPPFSDGNDSDLSMAKRWQQHMADANLGSALNINASLGQDIQIGNSTQQRTLSCKPGYWCSAATMVECGENTYQPEINQITAGACRQCPDDAVSPRERRSASKTASADQATMMANPPPRKCLASHAF